MRRGSNEDVHPALGPDSQEAKFVRDKMLLSALLMLCCVGLLEAMMTGETSQTLLLFSTLATYVPRSTTACLLEDVLAAMREALGVSGQVMPGAFGTCTASGTLLVLMELATDAMNKTGGGLELLHSTEVSLVVEEKDQEVLMLNFGFPQSPLLQRKPLLLLTLEHPVSGGDLAQITFTSQSLCPNTQAVCLSEGMQYILLTGQGAMGDLRWKLSIETKSLKMKKRIKELLTGGNTQSSTVTPVLLFPRQDISLPLATEDGGPGSDTTFDAEERSAAAIFPQVFQSTVSTSITRLKKKTEQNASEWTKIGDTDSFRPIFFLCELRRFLSGVLPHNRPDSPPLRLDSLPALPPVTLGLSSSESVLAELINSSAPTVFSFTGFTYHVHRGELAMPPGLLDELRQNLEFNMAQVTEVLRDKGDSQRSIMRLHRLWELCAFSKLNPVSGESQYSAFLLLKALKMVNREVLPKPRVTRAQHEPSTQRDACRLKSLTVSLESFLVGPNTANINNCHGLCSYPMVNTKNHAVLLNSHIENGNMQERAPCCVPVAYESLEVVDFDQNGTQLYKHPDMVATKCECR
nr:muellerian-inhibiting factor-like [Nerophis lumbriciformis]